MSFKTFDFKPFVVNTEDEMVVFIPRSGSQCQNAVQDGLSKVSPCFDAAVWDDNLKAFDSRNSSPLVFNFSEYES